ncbi:hypothetical protein [Streptomyces sp. NPDC093223]|uniref:hypothetical protein n=1 Tax=Streptomyces sp. NPDC093223 TaxID=3366033 RepID=UPI00381F8464
MHPARPVPIRYQTEEKIRHLLAWAAGWSGGSRGESLWSYSLGLGGSHALLSGWLKNPRLLAALTPQERDLLSEARRRSGRRAVRHADDGAPPVTAAAVRYVAGNSAPPTDGPRCASTEGTHHEPPRRQRHPHHRARA